MYEVFLYLWPTSEHADVLLLVEAKTALDAMLQAMHLHQLVYVLSASAYPLTERQARIVRCVGLDILGHAVDMEVL